MTKEEKIKAIYEKIADKTLSFGCMGYVKFGDYKYRISYISKEKNKIIIQGFEHGKRKDNSTQEFKLDNWLKGLEQNSKCIVDGIPRSKIIGHPVMIGRCDVLIEKGPDYFDDWIEILDLWENKDEPIENQNEKCITKIYNLTIKYGNKI